MFLPLRCFSGYFLLTEKTFTFDWIILMQVYSMLQGKRDVETVLTMGIMEDVSIVPQPAGGIIQIILVTVF